MKKQSGFTLIELMVVMTIIAILAVAGLAGYTGYIKKARDTARMSDLATINKSLLTVIANTGKSPGTIANVIVAIKAVNNGASLKDPQSGQDICQPVAGGTSLAECGYKYAQCDNGGGFVVSTRFESQTNQARYTADGIDTVAGLGGGSLASNVDDYWSLGSCTAPCASAAACDNGTTGEGIKDHTLIE